MGKLVVLRLDGDSFQQGFRVTLSISEEGSRPEIEMTGYLPPEPELANYLQHHWQEKYRRVGAPYRIKPKEIIYDGSINERLKECDESARQVRSRLTAWLDTSSFRHLDKRLREELNRDEVIRVLICTRNQQIQKLPWHLWDFFDRYPKAEVALSNTEYERLKKTTSTLISKVKILAILGHSRGINTQTDRQLLENLPNAETTFLVEKTHQEINDQLWEQSWDVIFFAGHSETEGETGRIYINKTDSITINKLWYALKKAVERGLKLAIFNSCDGLGLARQLDDLQIPQMIVMRELVPDQVAQEFLKHFLTTFAGGKSFYLAVREARERLQGLESKFPCASWLPVIFQNLAADPPAWPELRSIQPRPWWRGLQTVLLTSVAVASLVMGMRSLGLLQSSELKAFDQMVQLRPAEKPDSRLLIVKVTEDDIKKLGGEYSLHDRTMLRLLKKLEEHQPRVIGLDIYRDRPEGEGHADLIKYLQKSKAQGASFASRIIPICITVSSLETNQLYPWEFEIICQSNDPDDQSLSVAHTGTVKKVNLPEIESQLKRATLTERINLYVENKIWYDASTDLAKIHELPQTWLNLLEAIDIDLKPLAKVPISGSVVPIAESKPSQESPAPPYPVGKPKR